MKIIIVMLSWLTTGFLIFTVATVNLPSNAFSPRFDYSHENITSNKSNPFMDQKSMDESNQKSPVTVTPRGFFFITYLTWYFWPQISVGLHGVGDYLYCHTWKHCDGDQGQSWSLAIGDNSMVSALTTPMYCKLWASCGNDQWSLQIGDKITAAAQFVYCRLWVGCPDQTTGSTPWSLHIGELLNLFYHYGLYCHIWSHCPSVLGGTTWSLHIGEMLYCKLWKHCPSENGQDGWSLHVEGFFHIAKCKLWPWAQCDDTGQQTWSGSNITVAGYQWTGTGMDSTFTMVDSNGQTVNENFDLVPAVDSAFALNSGGSGQMGGSSAHSSMGMGNSGNMEIGNGEDIVFNTGDGVDSVINVAEHNQAIVKEW